MSVFADLPGYESFGMIMIKLLLASIAGGIIGFEREIHGRPAGMRTHLLVSLGSCLMMIISEAFFVKYGSFNADSVLRLDPSRLAAQIVTGIGFLGAGVILKEGISVRGLTTAACLWVVAGIGMAFGVGMFIPAFFCTLIALFSLVVLKKLEPHIKKDRYLNISIVADNNPDPFSDLEEIFLAERLFIKNIESDVNLENNEIRYDFILTRHHRRLGRELSARIQRLPQVKRIRFR